MLKSISKLNNKKYDGVIKFTPEVKELVTRDNDKFIISYPSNYSTDYEYLYDLVLNDLNKVIVDELLKKLPRERYKDIINILIDLEDVSNMSLFYNYIGDFLNKLDYDLLAVDVFMPLESKYAKYFNILNFPFSETVTYSQALQSEIKPVEHYSRVVTKEERKRKGKDPKELKEYSKRRHLIEKLKKEKDLPPNLKEYLAELELEELYDSLDLDSEMFVKPKANKNLLYTMQAPGVSNDKINKKYNQMIKEMNEAANNSKNLGEYITSLLKAKGLKQAELAFMTGLDPSLISKLVGKNSIDSYNAKKDTLALVAFGLELRVKEAKRLFELGGFILRPRETWDKVVLFVLENAEAGEFDYDINIVNTYLQRLGMDIITTRNYKERGH